MTEQEPNWLYRFLGWFSGTPAEQIECKHPSYARDARMTMLPEEEGMDFYEECTICGKEWHDG